MMGSVIAPHRATFRAVVETVVKPHAPLDERSWLEVESIVDRAMAERPARMRRQLRLLLRVIDWLPIARHGRRFASLDSIARIQLLERLQDARSILIRRGFWGLRTLAFMGYYARSDAAAEIGYRADPRGWDALRSTDGQPGPSVVERRTSP